MLLMCVPLPPSGKCVTPRESGLQFLKSHSIASYVTIEWIENRLLHKIAE